VDEFALASRLSYFLWSSLPDDQLFKLAGEGKLRANLRAQVDRMFKDDKSRRFVRNFAGQWLQTRDVETVSIDAQRILRMRNGEDTEKIFNGRIRRAMRSETETMFGHLVKENRPLTELISADYTFLNEALAGFYGLRREGAGDAEGFVDERVTSRRVAHARVVSARDLEPHAHIAREARFVRAR